MPLTELSPFASLDEFVPASFLARVYVPGRGVCQGVQHITESDFPRLAAWLHAHCCRWRRSAEESAAAEKQSMANGGWCDRCGNAAGYFLTAISGAACWEPSGGADPQGRWYKENFGRWRCVGGEL
jgi:hypothetical protein